MSTLRSFADKSLSVKDFVEVKKSVTKAQEQLKTTLKQKINRLLGKAGDGSMSIGDIDTLGVFDSSDTSLSFMTVVDLVSRASGRREVDKQVVVFKRSFYVQIDLFRLIIFYISIFPQGTV